MLYSEHFRADIDIGHFREHFVLLMLPHPLNSPPPVPTLSLDSSVWQLSSTKCSLILILATSENTLCLIIARRNYQVNGWGRGGGFRGCGSISSNPKKRQCIHKSTVSSRHRDRSSMGEQGLANEPVQV
jgi:hypothetical protein